MDSATKDNQSNLKTLSLISWRSWRKLKKTRWHTDCKQSERRWGEQNAKCWQWIWKSGFCSNWFHILVAKQHFITRQQISICTFSLSTTCYVVRRISKVRANLEILDECTSLDYLVILLLLIFPSKEYVFTDCQLLNPGLLQSESKAIS